MFCIYLNPEQKHLSLPKKNLYNTQPDAQIQQKNTKHKRGKAQPLRHCGAVRMHQGSGRKKFKIKKNEEDDWAKKVTCKNKSKDK